MTSTSNITQHVTRNTDLAAECSDASGRKIVFFNVSKVYEKQDIYVFESTMEVSCGEAYYLKVKQSGHTRYRVTKTSVSAEDLQAIVNALFSDTLISVEEFKERDNRRSPDRKVPNISLPPNLLADYLSSANYKDLCHSCGILISK